MPILYRSNVETAMCGLRGRGNAILGRLRASCGCSVMPLILFQRDNCHLCELALGVLAQARIPEFETVFIDDDAALEARYGVRVPVLRDTARGVELDWPFTMQALQAFLATG